MKPKKLTALQVRKIRERNRKFKRLTPAGKRVAIAKDVLAQLNAKMILARSGVYFSSKPVEELLNTYESVSGSWNYDSRQDKLKAELEDTQLCDVLEGQKCTVCGIGAAFVSAVRLGDDLTVPNAGTDDGSMREYLVRYFEPEQVGAIESAFEEECFMSVAVGWGVTTAQYDLETRAIAFGQQYRSDAKRLRAIFENIIANKGTFVPPPVDGDA